MDEFSQLKEDIADIIKNYKRNELWFELNSKHVDKWIRQFEEDEQLIVLRETFNLLNNNYMDKKKVKAYFNEIWNCSGIMGDNPEEELDDIQFLNIQRKGTSQSSLIELLEKTYLKEHDVNINKKNHSGIKKYIYIDDCMYTGQTVRNDIKYWIDNCEPNCNTELILVFLGLFTGNLDYKQKEIEQICADRNIQVKFFSEITYNNNIYSTDESYDFLWPEKIEGNEYVDAYIEELENERSVKSKKGLDFRTWIDNNNNTFTSIEDRRVFEQALLKAGAYIVSLPANRNPRIRPMGFSSSISLGFGAFFATYLNISNNCPLAFWWGDPWKDKTDTLGKWYPLLPREVN